MTPIGDKAFCAGIEFKTCATVSNCREAYDQLACGNKKLDPKKKECLALTFVACKHKSKTIKKPLDEVFFMLSICMNSLLLLRVL